VTCFLPDPALTRATHKGATLSEPGAASYDHLVVILPASAAGDGTWPAFAHSDHLRQLYRRIREPGEATVLNAVLPDAHATGVSVGFCKPDADTFTILASARRAVTEALRQRLTRVAVLAPGFESDRQALVLRCVVGALAAGAVPMPRRKRVSGDGAATAVQALEQIDTFGDCQPADYVRELAEAEGNALARWLAALPSNELTVAGYLDRIRALADTFDWELTVLGREQLADAGANAFLAVAQGSVGKPESAPALVRLRYRPDGGNAPAPADVALVGKGICFDTGGVNVKPVQYMQTMNEDMQGSAVALGTLLAISRLRLPLAVDAWLALAENTIGPAAYKPQDVITAANGTTIEIVHTDAEGRMVLADTLHLAANETPALMVDLATLTGACVTALTTAVSGVFTNRPAMHPQLIAAGSDSGERVWPFPLHEDFDQALESDIADIRQCAVEGRGDHILAARFLQRFVPDRVPWVHVDLAASRHKGGLAHVPTDITGFGVRFLLNLLLDQLHIDRAADEGPHRE
jgi:leucyl aminopeptidase